MPLSKHRIKGLRLGRFGPNYDDHHWIEGGERLFSLEQAEPGPTVSCLPVVAHGAIADRLVIVHLKLDDIVVKSVHRCFLFGRANG